MKIKLLVDEYQNGQPKTTIRMNRKQVILWCKGAEIEVSEATGRKLIAASKAEDITPAAEPAPAEEEAS